jgi:hypothetical protein
LAADTSDAILLPRHWRIVSKLLKKLDFPVFATAASLAKRPEKPGPTPTCLCFGALLAWALPPAVFCLSDLIG